MKKVFFILFIAAAAFTGGCVESPEGRGYAPRVMYLEDFNNSSRCIKVVVVDSCEYVVFSGKYGYAGMGGITHKANCRFCAERARRQREN